MTSTTTYAIEAKGLVKRYGDKTALKGVDLAVPAGTVTAVLGPNGAGKTTAVRILTTLTKSDGGSATVGGFDVATQGTLVRRSIGLAAQDATVDGLLTGRENLRMLGELHHLGKAAAAQRADELLEDFSLTDAGDRLAKEYSGGMRRRLDLAATIVARPEVLFLDEPTTGLDPRARNELWAVLDSLVGRGTTLMLTTQYLEEAERLADDIVVIDHGKVIAQGDSRELKRRVGGDQLQVVVSDPAQLEHAAAILGRGANAEAQLDVGARLATVPTRSGVAALAAVSVALADAGIEVDDLGMRQPTLDEVFLTLTGAPADAPSINDELEEAAR
ncbi:MAG: ATP-binding cassette domain-containing protein [Patulibacter minatonensis]